MAASAHVLCSSGARRHGESEFDRYGTTTEIVHGRNDYEPNPTPRQRGTGWSSNFRPGVYYQNHLDHKDNPALGILLRDSQTHSRTMKDYLASRGDDGRSTLPKETHMVKSGFVREVPRTIPTRQEVHQSFVDKRELGKIVVEPKHKAMLSTLTPRDPVERENFGHGPSFMSTEVKHRFTGQPSDRMKVDQLTVGYKTGSGWSHSINREPITQRPDDPFSDQPVDNVRPVGLSLGTVDYRPAPVFTGREDFPMTSPRAQKDTGYTRWVDTRSNLQHRRIQSAYTPLSKMPPLVASRLKRTDPAEFSNSAHPNNYSSFTNNSYPYHPPRLARSAPPQLYRQTIGFKEPSGERENNDQYFGPPDKLEHYVTHYSVKHNDMNPQGKQRRGHTTGNVMDQQTAGFGKSTLVHQWAPERQPDEEVRQLHPYVAKSLLKRDPLYVDYTHSHKKRL